MTGKRRELSDSTPLLGYPQPLQHYTPFSSSLLEMAATTTTVDSAPLRSVFLGVDVGTGSARAGPLSLSSYIYTRRDTHTCMYIYLCWLNSVYWWNGSFVSDAFNVFILYVERLLLDWNRFHCVFFFFSILGSKF